MKDLENDNLDKHHLDNNTVNIKENLSATSSTKTYQSSRTSSIYERFLNRVQQIDSDIKADDTIKESHHIKASVSLDDAELSLFTPPNPPINAPKVSTITNDEHDEYKIVEPLSHHDSVVDATNLVSTQTALLKSEQRSHLKPMIAGIVCGLLLSIFIILVLNTTGVLDTLSERFSSTTTPVSTTNDNEPTASSEPLNSEGPVIKTDVKTVEVTQEVSSADQTVASSNLTDETPNIGEPKEQDSTNPVVEESEANTANTEAPISYEDFREEAQNTLYRDIKD